MDISKYTEKAINTIKKATQLAISYNNSEVSDLHLFYAIILTSDYKIREYFRELDIIAENIKDDLVNAIGKLRSSKGLTNLFTSRSYQKVLLISEEISRNQYSDKVYPYHILLAILKDRDNQSAKIAKLHGLTYENLEKIISKKFNEELIKGIDNETINYLNKYGRVLTKEANEGKLDPVIGREEETRNAIRVLSRRIKNNPVLIGEAGVGKTAIVEGIVQRIANGDVPDDLKEKLVFSLDISSLVAGAKYRGDFEDRLKRILEIVRDSDGKIILFIDEIHNIIGSGASSGAMDTANILKPMLARGEILTIGATTIEEYRKYIESDRALERRFQKILVDEPDIDTTVAILRGIKVKYENYHLVKITDKALIQAAKLSKRFLTERKLPDVAIDVIDEACAIVKIARDQKPEELYNLHKKIVQLEMEKIALNSEKNELSQKINLQKEKQIQKLEKELKDKTNLYNLEKERQENILNKNRDIYLLEFDIEKAKSKRDLDKLDDLIETKKKLEDDLYKIESKEPYYPLKTKVTENEVKEIISKLSAMPKRKINSDRLTDLDNIRESLNKEFIGASEMIDKVLKKYMISKSGLVDFKKPVLSFIITGASGSGKTYFAKLLSDYLYEGEKSFIRFDMSEFSEKSSITKLIGAPPGYIGYESGGALTEAIRTKPYSVVLFENVDKANREIQNLIIQIVQEGKIKDNKGRNINLNNAIIVMSIRNDLDKDIALEDKLQTNLYDYVDYIFNIEKLEEYDIKKIINLNIERLKDNLKDHQIELVTSDEFISKFYNIVIENNLDIRQIQKIFEQEIYYEISKEFLEKKLKDFSQIKLTIENDKFVVNQINKGV